MTTTDELRTALTRDTVDDRVLIGLADAARGRAVRIRRRRLIGTATAGVLLAAAAFLAAVDPFPDAGLGGPASPARPAATQVGTISFSNLGNHTYPITRTIESDTVSRGHFALAPLPGAPTDDDAVIGGPEIATLAVGDIVTIDIGGARYRYRVDQTFTVTAEMPSKAPAPAKTLTLWTSTPALPHSTQSVAFATPIDR
ncbi:hypothetical protein [Embleya sp. NBC_00896]|uniref:hypothetical protein n=1 Tax=Embleya sp. NBC_00896 TaxID=2975961 RepID=UPI002F919A76|nr:hypothetical protein OG928_34760 [Embleya sp. NBC_00896]